MLQNLCTPALIYLIFSITQITIDIFKRDFNVALVKFFVAFIFTILLNYLCQSGLGIVSWVIVFIPFILMSIIVTYILTFFGIDPKTKKVRILQDGEVLVDKDEQKEKEKEELDKTSPVLTEISSSYNEEGNKIEVSFNSNERGKVWCKAVQSVSTAPTVSSIQNGITSQELVEGPNTCEITDYTSDKNHYIYLYSEDVNGNKNDDNDILKTKNTIFTGDTDSNNGQPGSDETADLSGSTTGTADLSGSTTGTADLSGSTTGTADLSGSTTGTADLSGSTTGTADLSGTSYDPFSLISESIGFMNTKSGFSNYYQNNSKLYKKRQQHIDKINNILVKLNENDTSAYFTLQASTCANKPTNTEYELCMKRVIQEIYLKIKTDKNKQEFLKMLKHQNINIKGLTSLLI